ncbi:hypothetical protein QE152_g8211 [Popillia japonica]|uniref:Uncharacterized protein n=1 Tax=Popillia japonica TaxID=7064 RepID=A0AAW1MCE1_POPJA
MFGKGTIILISITLLSNLNLSESACGGVLGTVQDPVVSRNSTVSITWNPPVGWADCDEEYWERYRTQLLAQSIITSAEFLCQIFVIDIIAKYNNINGEIYNTIAVADRFESVVVDPVQNLRIQELGNNVLIRWEPSTQFKACWANVYDVQIYEYDGNRLVSSWIGQREFYSFDYKAENLCETELLIKVTAMFREFAPSILTRMFITGAC